MEHLGPANTSVNGSSPTAAVSPDPPRGHSRRRPRVMAVMPAYNAAQTLERTVRDIPTGSVDEILLVDDCSRDNTVEVARRLGLRVIEHSENRGYGGNQKTC